MAAVEIIQGAATGQRFPLIGDEIVVGRHINCRVVLPSRSISRRHVRIFRESDGYYAEDLQSCNGTYLNGERLKSRRRLRDQDRLQLEDHVLLFHDDGSRSGRREPHASETGGGDLTQEVRPVRSTTIIKTLDPRTDPRLDVNSELKLRIALETARNLGSTLDVDEILPKVLESLFAIFPQAVLGYALLAEPPGNHLTLRALKHRTESDDSFTLSPLNRNIARLVMSDGKAILSSDSDTDERTPSVLDGQSLSVMCAPLIGPSGRRLGIIHVDTQDPERPFEEDDLELLVSLTTVAAQAVEYAQMHEARMELDRQERELATARDVQLHFLPHETPNIAGYRFFEYYRAAQAIGGDYYGYIELPEGRLAIAVGDVAGKGISAALLMARLCSDVRYSLVTSNSASEAVRRLNRELTGPIPSLRFITFAVCVLDPARHELTVVNSGHVPPFLRRAATREVELVGVEASGPPLGMHVEKRQAETTIALSAGDTVVLVTDGLSEAMNSQGDLYGLRRIQDVIHKGPDAPAALGQALLEDLGRFTMGQAQRDDICLLCFNRER